jgi:hypothetical protein
MSEDDKRVETVFGGLNVETVDYDDSVELLLSCCACSDELDEVQ